MTLIQTLPQSRRRGSARFGAFVHFIFSLRFILGCGAGMLLMGGYARTSPPKVAPCPLLATAPPAARPPPLVITVPAEGPAEKTMLVASETVEVYTVPKKGTKTEPSIIVRFDRRGNCLQIKESERLRFIPDGCIVFGSKVKNRTQFKRQYARTKAQELGWKMEEAEAARRF